MQTTTTSSRILSAALAFFCSFGLLAVVGEQLNPARLATTPQVFQMEPVVITAPAAADPKPLAAAEARTAAN
jgi:hypothetical protein